MIEQGFIPPRGDIRQLHVTFTWCDDNVSHQVTKHTHEQIYMKHIESNMIITMRQKLMKSNTHSEKSEIYFLQESRTR